MTTEEELAKRIHDMEIWAAGHEGRINEKWDNQDLLNRGTKRKVAKLLTDVSDIKMSLVKWSALAAAAGSLGGSAAPKILSLFGGM